jgi:pimeloyl-ACP methyl ester carboxylesterase
VADGVTVLVDAYAPGAAGRYPIVLLRHGLTRSRENFAGWGKDLAARGFVVVAPDARDAWNDDPDGDASDILTVMSWALGDTTLSAKIDPSRRILGGHSSGGLAALVAASRDPSLSALLLLDTEGDDPRGPRAAALVTAPTLGVFGAPNMLCNENGDGVSSFAALAGPRFGLRIEGASHCAAENPSGMGCELPCGSVSDEAQQLYQHYVVGFLEAFIGCDQASFTALATPTNGVDLFTSQNRGSACAPK